MSFVRQRAYSIRHAPIPYHHSTLRRWEDEGRITLVHIAGKTLITDEEIDRILAGEADLPSRFKVAAAKTAKRPRGRPRKVRAEAEGVA